MSTNFYKFWFFYLPQILVFAKKFTDSKKNFILNIWSKFKNHQSILICKQPIIFFNDWIPVLLCHRLFTFTITINISLIIPPGLDCYSSTWSSLKAVSTRFKTFKTWELFSLNYGVSLQVKRRWKSCSLG